VTDPGWEEQSLYQQKLVWDLHLVICGVVLSLVREGWFRHWHNHDLVRSMIHADEDPQENNRLEGRYANYFKVGYNAVEFVLDFGQFYSDNRVMQFHTRVISIPLYAKALLQTLGESIEQYEQMFGAIPGEAE
jgi:Protein of unknown function (DUF3467)